MSLFRHQRILFAEFCVPLHRILQRVQDILLNSFTITTAMHEQNFFYWDCTLMGAAFPYKEVVCGEP